MGAAGALRDANGYAREPWESARYQADMAMLRDELCDEELEAAFAAGARWSIEEAVTQAARGRWRRPATGWPSLTEAEQQVVALVAEGLTNPEIAERLFITLGTVKAHLSHIFSKLGITGRRELVREFSVERRDSQAAWSGESIAQRATPKAG
jgi:DNA-binding CsgD family transcriptional regulator